MNKGELRTHIKDVLNRTDVTDALVDTFIFQTLSRIQRLLRIPSMEKLPRKRLLVDTMVL